MWPFSREVIPPSQCKVLQNSIMKKTPTATCARPSSHAALKAARFHKPMLSNLTGKKLSSETRHKNVEQRCSLCARLLFINHGRFML
jgi:hypothetical protein